MGNHVSAANPSLSSHPFVICGRCCSAKDPQERPDCRRSPSPGPGWHPGVAAVTSVGALRGAPESANSCWMESPQLGVKSLDTKHRMFRRRASISRCLRAACWALTGLSQSLPHTLPSLCQLCFSCFLDTWLSSSQV